MYCQTSLEPLHFPSKLNSGLQDFPGSLCSRALFSIFSSSFPILQLPPPQFQERQEKQRFLHHCLCDPHPHNSGLPQSMKQIVVIIYQKHSYTLSLIHIAVLCVCLTCTNTGTCTYSVIDRVWKCVDS